MKVGAKNCIETVQTYTFVRQWLGSYHMQREIGKEFKSSRREDEF